MNKCCEWCGKELLNTRSPKRKFCNDICRARYRRSEAASKGTYLVTCCSCGKEFRTYHDRKKYCSKDCRSKGGNVSIEPYREKIVYKLTCDECGQNFETSFEAQRFCSYKCKTKNRGKLNELERRKYYIAGDNSITLAKLIEKENNICSICGEACDSFDYETDKNGTIICGNGYPSIDHVIPLSKGGKHEWSNVHLAHRGCNIKKSNRVLENLG